MIFIHTALHHEAAPLIDFFGLKRDLSVRAREIFVSDEIRLVVGGIGKLRSAVATTLLLAANDYEQEHSVLFNVGVAGGPLPSEVGMLFWINKIVDHSSNRRYFPDIILKHGLQERALVTTDKPVSGTEMIGSSSLVDMEASGVFEAGYSFLSTSQVYCVKVVSDNCDPESTSLAQFEGLIASHVPAIGRIIRDYAAMLSKHGRLLGPDQLSLLSAISDALTLSDSQRRVLNDLATARVLAGKSLDCMADFLARSPQSRNDRKRIFEELRGVVTSA